MSELHVKLGELLELERSRQGVALEDVSTELKIPEDTLLHIEAGEVDALPAELYFKLFAKSYAEYLGIDYSKTVEAIREEIGEPVNGQGETETEGAKAETRKEPTEKARREAKGEADLSSFMKKAGVIGGLVVAGFVVIIVIYQFFLKSDSASTGANEPGQPGETTAVAAQEQSLAENYDWETQAYEPPDSIRLVLVPREPSWAAIFSDGDTALYRNLVPGNTYRVSAQYRMTVSVGIPRVVDITLDGQPAFLRSGTTGSINRVMIDQTNKEQFLTPPEPATRSNPRLAPDRPSARPVTSEEG